MKNLYPSPSRLPRQEGYLLLGVLVMILLLLITLAVAAPKVAEDIRRDKEAETVHRGMQYARAIQVYYNRYGRYPNTIDQLMKTDNQRFLRKRYKDPLTGKDDWRIIHNGEQQVPTLGLFGQPAQVGTPPGALNNNNGLGSSNPSSPSSSFGSRERTQAREEVLTQFLGIAVPLPRRAIVRTPAANSANSGS